MMRERLRRAKQQFITAYTRAADLDQLHNLSQDQIDDLRTIASGFRIIDRLPVYVAGLNHAAESLLSRAASMPTTRLVAACGYYLCMELTECYATIGYDDSAAPILPLTRSCDLASGGKEDTRLLILVAATANAGKFRLARLDVNEAVARSISSATPRQPQRITPSIRCRALVAAAHISGETGNRRLVRKTAEQLIEGADSDGYRALGELFLSQVTHQESGYFQVVQEAERIAASISHTDPARDLIRQFTREIDDYWTADADAGDEGPSQALVVGSRLMQAREFNRAAAVLSRAADEFDDPFGAAVSAIFAFGCQVGAPEIVSVAEAESALEDLARHDFAWVRTFMDCSDPFRNTLLNCASTDSSGPSGAWLAARVADLLGEYSGGMAVGSTPLFDRASDTATREHRLTDLMTGKITFTSTSMLRAMAQVRTILWVNQINLGEQLFIVTILLGPHDDHPKVSTREIRSPDARQILHRAKTSGHLHAPEEIVRLSQWAIPNGINPAYPLLIIPDRPLWSLPWAALIPEQMGTMTLMPSAASAARLDRPSRSPVPVVAGVFDTQLAGAQAELSALQALEAEHKIVLLRAASLPQLQHILVEENVDVLTIAAHGTSGDGFEYRLLFPDSPASPAGLLGMRLPPHVILGCCWSAHLGEQADSLSTALACLSAGASSVVGALWAVNDQAAGQLLATVYREFAAGTTLADALQIGRKKAVMPAMDSAALTLLGLP
jgi:hypothetical protein